jgi:hemolysin activation/secretion protein
MNKYSRDCAPGVEFGYTTCVVTSAWRMRGRLALAAAAALSSAALPDLAHAQTPPATRDQVLRPVEPPQAAQPVSVDEALPQAPIQRVEIQGGTQEGRDFVRKAFSRLRPGEPVDRARLRQAFALAQAYGVYGLTLESRPAETGQGVVLLITVPRPKPWVYASAQNLSGQTVGRWSAGATLGLRGLTPYYDNTQIGVFHGLTGDRQQGVQVSSTALLTENGLGVRGDLSWFQERPHEKPPNQDTIGTTQLARAELNQAVFARGPALTRVRAGIEAVNQDTQLTTGAPTQHDRLRVAYAGVNALAVHGANETEVDLVIRQGVAALGASRRGDPLLSRPGADPQALVVRGSARVARSLPGDVVVEGKLRGQWTARPLLAFEEFNYGGFEGGRGLDPGALQGDRGFSAGVEFHKRGPNFLGGTLAPFVFAEHAQTWNLDSFGARHGSATFAGGGLRISFPNRLNAELSYATPVSHVVGAANRDLAGPRVLFVISKGFGG